MSEKKRYRKKNKGLVILGRVFAFIGCSIGVLLLLVIAVVFVVFRGPSKEASKLLTLSANETSAMKFLPYLFLPDELVEEYLGITTVAKEEIKEQVVFVPLPIEPQSIGMNGSSNEESQIAEERELFEVVDVKGATFKGKMLIVSDPSLVRIVSLDSFGGVGMTLGQFCKKYDAIGATNAGGFLDENGKGKGGIPDGLVIKNGKIAFGEAQQFYRDVVGFDSNHMLHVGDMSGQQALNEGIVDGVSFSIGPYLVKDGVKNPDMGSGINPRTCLGQCADGTVLMMAIEGRLPDSLGATFEDAADVLISYGAVNGANLDGGSSSGLYYNDERITRSCSVVGDRAIPTAVVCAYGLYQ